MTAATSGTRTTTRLSKTNRNLRSVCAPSRHSWPRRIWTTFRGARSRQLYARPMGTSVARCSSCTLQHLPPLPLPYSAASTRARASQLNVSNCLNFAHVKTLSAALPMLGSNITVCYATVDVIVQAPTSCKCVRENKRMAQ